MVEHPALPDRIALRRHLEAASAPVWETELLKVAWPDERQSDWPPLELYRRHFRLFSALHAMAAELHAEGWYLHVHFMRTRLVELPKAGQCSHYAAEAGEFCRSPLPCRQHPASDLPAAADSRAFYLDPANLEWLDEASAERLVHGAWELLVAWPRAAAAWETLGLPPGSGLEQVRRRFRELALASHPDTAPAGNHPQAKTAAGDFLRIRAAYALLCEVLPFLDT